ncbi:MAG: ribosome biogenesis/translation initiation ATPase RLI, partial [Candidatus Hodarchaeales archaeon]
LNFDKCKPDLCGYACLKYCPLVKKGIKNVITIRKDTGKPIINNRKCLMAKKGTCGVCINKCFPGAVSVVNLPSTETAGLQVHCYGENGFRFFGVPQIISGKVIGLLGVNGIGKSTLLEILAGRQLPNGGNFKNPEKGYRDFYDQLSIASFRQFSADLATDNLSVAYKPQVFTELLTRPDSVQKIIFSNHQEGLFSKEEVIKMMELDPIINRLPSELSGGELQRLAIGIVLLQNADIYLIDEPCTFLDFRQRINMAKIFHKIAKAGKVVFIAEHDIAIHDFQSDVIYIFYGKPHKFGVMSRLAYTVKKGINNFLLGKLKDENIRIRGKEIIFTRVVKERLWEGIPGIDYPSFTKQLGSFTLTANEGIIHFGGILGVLGENGLGKTTFAQYLFNTLKTAKVSYKPQFLHRKFQGTVRDFLTRYSNTYIDSKDYKLYILKPFSISHLLEKPVSALSGGELQRCFLAGSLGKKADLYIIDEGSAFLDVEERLNATRVIRHIVSKNRAACIAIEHDIQIAEALADTILLFEGEPGYSGRTIGPLSKKKGLNRFLSRINITFRRDPETGRARLNKLGSRLDREQREIEAYYYDI